MLVTQSVRKTLSLWRSPLPWQTKKGIDISWNATCYCMKLILGNVSIFKSMPLPVTGSFTATVWIWNVAINTGDLK
jgi:hypothetical protein